MCDSDIRLPDSVLRSNLRHMGLENIGIPRLVEGSNISKLAYQWQEQQNMAWLGTSPLDDEGCSAYMKCMHFNTEKLMGMLSNFVCQISISCSTGGLCALMKKTFFHFEAVQYTFIDGL